MRIGGPTCILIKQDRRPSLGLTAADTVLDIDVSLRHAEVTLGAKDCANLCLLSSAYLTREENVKTAVAEEVYEIKDSHTKPLFREDFWYFDGLQAPDEANSRELNFDTLSHLLEQVKPVPI